ncbi:MAG: PEP-CTERM sorting domain-containing protein [Terriglobales bacterium]
MGDYSTTFTLTSADLSKVALSGSWTLDDAGELLLNGNVIGTLGDNNWGSLTSFSVLAGSSDFVLGTNTLSIDITDTDSYLEGVNLNGTLTGAVTTPEPSSLGLMCLGVLGLLLVGRKRLQLPA